VKSEDTRSSASTTPNPLILVLHGGTSTERAVSLQSGAAVLEALQGASQSGAWAGRAEAVLIDADGRWSFRDEVLSEDQALLAIPPGAVVFNALHGGRGEGGDIQSALENAGVRYTGSGPAASALCMDKASTRDALMLAGLECSPGHLVVSLPAEAEAMAVLMAQLNGMNTDGHGWFVKPNRGGSSAGVQRVTHSEELLSAVESIITSGEEALVEVAITGVELSAGVMGRSEAELIAFTPVEIQPRQAAWFDESEKYDDKNGAREPCPPESVPALVVEEVKLAALTAHKATGCYGYSRTDFIYSQSGCLIVLEVNNLPGLTPRSLLPLEAAKDGVSFLDLCLAILSLAQDK